MTAGFLVAYRQYSPANSLETVSECAYVKQNLLSGSPGVRQVARKPQ